MMNTLLSTTKNVEEKKKELEQEYQIEMKSDLRKGLNLMCNLSELVEEQGAFNKIKELVEKKLKKGLSVEEIADMLEEPIETIQKAMIELQN